MFYETGISDPEKYLLAMREQLGQIQSLKEGLGGKAPQYLMGIGAFKNKGPLRKYRDLKIESIPSTLDLIKNLMREFPLGQHLVDGIAIYCEWLATPADWLQLSRHWVESQMHP